MLDCAGAGDCDGVSPGTVCAQAFAPGMIAALASNAARTAARLKPIMTLSPRLDSGAIILLAERVNHLHTHPQWPYFAHVIEGIQVLQKCHDEPLCYLDQGPHRL